MENITLTSHYQYGINVSYQGNPRTLFCEIELKDRDYDNLKLSILPGLCADVVLDHDFLNQH